MTNSGYQMINSMHENNDYKQFINQNDDLFLRDIHDNLFQMFYYFPAIHR